jgi:hypothetical protein
MSLDHNPIRILTVDDHALLREGIAALVNAEPDMKLVAEASSGEKAIEQFRLHRPDVTLMDLQMPGLNGIEAISRAAWATNNDDRQQRQSRPCQSARQESFWRPAVTSAKDSTTLAWIRSFWRCPSLGRERYSNT